MSSPSKSGERRNDDTQMTTPQPVPPDGGWGWCVVLASFLAHVISDGIMYTSGIILEEIRTVFNVSRGEMGWLASVMIGVLFGTSPITGALINRFGCRKVGMTGGLLSGIGMALSSMAQSITFLYFSYGIVTAVGLGMIFMPSVVSVCQYFEKKRSFAVGLAVCGSGVGTFAFAPLGRYLINKYNWRGTFLIQAGIALQALVCSSLYRPLLPSTPRKNTHEEIDIKLADRDNECHDDDLNSAISPTQPLRLIDHLDLSPHREPLYRRSESKSSPVYLSLPDITQPVQSPVLGTKLVKEVDVDQTDHPSSTLLGSHLLLPQVSGYLIHRSTPHILGSNASLNKRQMNKPEVNLSQMDMKIPQTDKGGEAEAKQHSYWKQKLVDFENSFDLSIFRSKAYLIMLAGNLVSCMSFNIPYIFLPDMAILRGISKRDAAFLISVIGILSTVSRVVLGWLADKQCVNRVIFFSVSVLSVGISVMLFPLCTGYWMFVLVATMFGIFQALVVALSSVVVVDLFGLQNMATNFGYFLMVASIAMTIGPPLAGLMFDSTGNYTVPFFVMGLILTLGSVLYFFVLCTNEYKDMRDRQREAKLQLDSTSDKKRTLSDERKSSVDV